MQEIIIIGTLHLGLTPNDELRTILEDISPERLFIEVTEKDLSHNTLGNYPPEMIFASQWARQSNVTCIGFDAAIYTLKEGVSEKDQQQVLSIQKNILSNITWKEMNQRKNWTVLDASGEILIDQEQWNMRENALVSNVKAALLPKGRNVIITGSGHLAAFERAFPGIKMPLS